MSAAPVAKNEWVRRSIELANGPGYLDRLSEVYPARGAERSISNSARVTIRNAYNERDGAILLKTLVRLEKFPITDSYVGFLKAGGAAAIDSNPRTVARIAEILLSMPVEAIVAGCEEPKRASRRLGSAFRQWLTTIGYEAESDGTEFRRRRGIVVFGGSNGAKKKFANESLGCELSKNPDLLIKVRERYVVGEAKFISRHGGGQDRQFDDAIAMVRARAGSAIRVAIVDGAIWIPNAGQKFATLSQLEEPVLSALLLKEFLESLG